MGALALEGKLIVFGGVGYEGISNVVEEYDPEAKKWTKLASMIERQIYSAVVKF